jgi:hypothetical protein
MTEITTTSNGYEIKQAVPVLSAAGLQERLSNEYGIDGNNPAKRIHQLKQLSVEGVAILLEDINKSVQGSADSLMSHDKTIPIGGKQTIKPEDRYNVFSRLVEDIKNCPDDVNPERVGDVLALGIVLLHPFHDGSGRTARVVGLVFRDSYDSEEYPNDFDTVIEPRDRARERGGFVIYGYTPRFPENFDESDPSQVSVYLSGLLQNENDGAYLSPYGQAPLHTQVEQMGTEHQARVS